MKTIELLGSQKKNINLKTINVKSAKFISPSKVILIIYVQTIT